LDLTTIARPAIRDLAAGLIRPDGATEQQIDTLATLMDGLINNEDLIGLA